MKRNRYPQGWNATKVRAILAHYEGQSEAEAVAEDEAAFKQKGQTVMVVPQSLVPAITQLIARRRRAPARTK